MKTKGPDYGLSFCASSADANPAASNNLQYRFHMYLLLLITHESNGSCEPFLSHQHVRIDPIVEVILIDGQSDLRMVDAGTVTRSNSPRSKGGAHPAAGKTG